jgi:hypothetical protein
VCGRQQQADNRADGDTHATDARLSAHYGGVPSVRVSSGMFGSRPMPLLSTKGAGAPKLSVPTRPWSGRLVLGVGWHSLLGRVLQLLAYASRTQWAQRSGAWAQEPTAFCTPRGAIDFSSEQNSVA